MGTPNLRSTPSTKVRWAPSQVQLRVLESLFEEQAGIALSKQQIKEITTQLSRHGEITDRNVYHWFQNRKARARQKQLVVTRACRVPPRPKSRDEGHAGRHKRKVREAMNESTDVRSTERPAAHKRRKPKDEKPNSSHGTRPQKRRGKLSKARGQNSHRSEGRGGQDRGRGRSEGARAQSENKQNSHTAANLATNRSRPHGNQSHAEPTVSHKSTGAAMDQHSATGSGAVQASTLWSNVPAGASGLRSLNNNDERSNNNAMQTEGDNNAQIASMDLQHPRSMQTGTLGFSPGISLAGGPPPSNLEHNMHRRADPNYSRDCSTQ